MSIYRPSTLGTGSNQITFNNLGVYPYYRITARMATRRELVEFDIKLPEGTGDADFESWIGKTYYIISGTMYPRDEASYDQGRKALRKLASLETQQNDAGADMGYVPYQWTESDGYNKQLFLKVMYVDLPESSRQGLKQPFKLLCKVKYPVIFGQQYSTASIGTPTALTTGGIGYPFNYPVAYGANTYTSGGAITNNGDLPTYPAGIAIYGPVNNPRITNTTTGKYIEVNINLATASDVLYINYDQDSVSITYGGNSKLNKLTSGSTLFKLPTGTSNLTLTGTTMGSGTYATMTCLPAWSLS